MTCRHEWQCDGWTVDPSTGTCSACGGMVVYWSGPVETVEMRRRPRIARFLRSYAAFRGAGVSRWEAARGAWMVATQLPS